MLRALLLAPPGAGKGTQGERLSEHYGVPHLAAGDTLRSHVTAGSEIGVAAAGFMERGELVPDRLVIEMVRLLLMEPVPVEGFILDGFPRTIGQARTAYEWGKANGRTFHVVISLDVPEDELVRRLLLRGEAAGRVDDTADTIRNRLHVYDTCTEPLLDFYRERGILVEVDGTGPVEAVTARVVDGVDALYPALPD